jgi:DNA-binding MarR family transcriptional regulator
MSLEAVHIKQALQQELARRCEANPKYSLRSFAAALGISHTLLSLVISGKRNPSGKLQRRIRDLLGPEVMTQMAGSQSPIKTSGTVVRYEQISLDTFSFISEWHHYAILSLLEIADSKFDSRWIAKRLGITQAQAKLAMERLERVGMISKINGQWKQVVKPLKVENEISTSATRKFHRQLLSKAAESLEEDSVEVRDFSSTTIAIDSKLIPYAKERIRKFRRELCEELEKSSAPKEVYHLSVQIFPLSRKEK